MRYILDTHALIWLFSSQDNNLPTYIRESVRYCEDSFFVSEVSLIEIIQLQQGKRITLNYRPDTVRSMVEENGIIFIPATTDILTCYFDMPIPTIKGARHSDPFDRIIIATALKRNMTVVSADTKFPWYSENYGLELLQI